jgi:cadmium resistance protein CadD (predicted permease)
MTTLTGAPESTYVTRATRTVASTGGATAPIAASCDLDHSHNSARAGNLCDTMLRAVTAAVLLFAATNVDDMLLLALYFGQPQRDRAAERRIVVGQYLGVGAIIAISLLGAFAFGHLPSSVTAYLGLVPLALGVRAGIEALEHHRQRDEASVSDRSGPKTARVAAVTLSNGGDNIGVYVPVFTAIGPAVTAVYVIVFSVMVAVWCIGGRFFATRPPVASALERWGHIVLPVVLIAIGVTILVQGGAFGL